MMHGVWWLLTVRHERLVTAGRLNHLFLSPLTERIFMCVLCLQRVCVLRVAIQVCVWHRKGCDGNAVVQAGNRHGSETLATVLGCGKTPLSLPVSTPIHHNKHPAICRSVGMPPSARVLASTTVLPTV